MELITRARDTLSKAQVSSDSYQALTPACRPGGQGSSCDLHFASEADLELARSKVRAIAHKAYPEGKIVWLDIKKSRDELLPARRVKTLAEMVECIAKTDEGRNIQVSMDQRTRSVSVDGTRVASASPTGVTWSAAGRALFAQEDREWVESVVASCR